MKRNFIVVAIICTLSACTIMTKENLLTIRVDVEKIESSLSKDSVYNLTVYKSCDGTVVAKETNMNVVSRFLCFNVIDVLKVSESYNIYFEIIDNGKIVYHYQTKDYVYTSTNVKFDVIPIF